VIDAGFGFGTVPFLMMICGFVSYGRRFEFANAAMPLLMRLFLFLLPLLFLPIRLWLNRCSGTFVGIGFDLLENGAVLVVESGGLRWLEVEEKFVMEVWVVVVVCCGG
jgi:hypothetical protein